MSFNEQDILEKMMISISDFFSLEPRIKCKRGIVFKSAYKDILAFLKLKRSKNQVKSFSNDFDPKHQNHNNPFDYMSYGKLPNQLEDSMFHSTQPSAPPIPNSTTFGNKANILECQRKRTPKYATWAFTALGRVLHFLEITKVEEMNEEACEWLQVLWDEVQVFGFDLSWLAPQVEFAFEYGEKMSKVNMLEEEKKRLEVRIQELSMELFETKKEMESSKDGLEKFRVELEDFDLLL
ncbi:MATH domain and coiled-coil domain-containing protein [Trifolium repens]|nr:MATH domain and coiled-coil domain-containing protein [Trifolium repens]